MNINKNQIRPSITGSGQLVRVLTLMALDALMVGLSYLLALLFRFDFEFGEIPQNYYDGYLVVVLPIVCLLIGLFWVFRLYHSVWSFASMVELERLVGAWAALFALTFTAGMLVGPSMPRSFWVFGAILGFISTTMVRFSRRFFGIVKTSIRRRHNQGSTEGVMLVGAGEAGRALLREINANPDLNMEVRCVIDDNPAKLGHYLEGVQVVGDSNSIGAAAERHNIDQIILAVPSAPGAERKRLLAACQETGLKVRALPSMGQLVGGQVEVARLREVRLEDLLGRDPVVVDNEQVHGLVNGKVVLVTGGGGSIGSELCRQIAADRPARLVILDVYENGAYDVQMELQRKHPGLDLRVLIGSVRDEARVRAVFAEHRPQVVFHAAAHKHVPLMEDSPCEAVKNNVGGTLNVGWAAAEFGAERFVLISTDKAVNPTNVMGATKRVCEMTVQMMNRSARAEGLRCEYVAVRFGNVLGSNGSVVPLFERQIAEGGPVTVTDKRIVRYFMTIPEAVSLVLQAACFAHGGEIFVLDMGEPVRIDDMARQLIRLAGYEPDVDIHVVYTGLRPGEKLFEEKLMDEEGLEQTPNSLIHIAHPIEMDDAVFAGELGELRRIAAAGDEAMVCELLAQTVGTYHPEMAA